MKRALEPLLARPGLAADDRLFVALLGALVKPDQGLIVAAAEALVARGTDPGRLREACLQGVLFAGFPRALAALEALSELLPPTTSTGTPPPAVECRRRGEELFRRIYGPQSDRVLERLTALDPTFTEFVVEQAYGRVLTRPGLELRVRELMAVGALSVLEQVPQLRSHARGAIHAGASESEVLEAAATVALLFGASGGVNHVSLLRSFLQTDR